MRIAVFSDIHGNPFALKAVLNAIRDAGGFDSVVAAGDLCLGGSNPSKCVDLLIKNNVQAIQGNTDTYIFNWEKIQKDEANRHGWNRIMETINWTYNQLGNDRIIWLSNLPFELSFTPTDNPKDELLVVHANPKNTLDIIGPPYDDQVALNGEVSQKDDDPTLHGLLADEHANMIAFGHVHYPSVRYWQAKTLVNVAPCGVRSYTGDNRARYTIFNWKRNKWIIEQRVVEYAYLKHSEAILSSTIPNKEEEAKRFQSSK